MKLVIETTDKGWQEKLTVGRTTYGIQFRIQEDGGVRSDEGLTFCGMLKKRGVDPDTAEKILKAIDLPVGIEVGFGMYSIEEQNKKEGTA